MEQEGLLSVLDVNMLNYYDVTKYLRCNIHVYETF
jgi:hypothetical protein